MYATSECGLGKVVLRLKDINFHARDFIEQKYIATIVYYIYVSLS